MLLIAAEGHLQPPRAPAASSSRARRPTEWRSARTPAAAALTLGGAPDINERLTTCRRAFARHTGEERRQGAAAFFGGRCATQAHTDASAAFLAKWRVPFALRTERARARGARPPPGRRQASTTCVNQRPAFERAPGTGRRLRRRGARSAPVRFADGATSPRKSPTRWRRLTTPRRRAMRHQESDEFARPIRASAPAARARSGRLRCRRACLSGGDGASRRRALVWRSSRRAHVLERRALLSRRAGAHREVRRSPSAASLRGATRRRAHTRPGGARRRHRRPAAPRTALCPTRPHARNARRSSWKRR